jgi:hypothetical protein
MASQASSAACDSAPGGPQVHGRHAELMAKLQEEKERRLLELESLWRARVQQEELLKLKHAQVRTAQLC